MTPKEQPMSNTKSVEFSFSFNTSLAGKKAYKRRIEKFCLTEAQNRLGFTHLDSAVIEAQWSGHPNREHPEWITLSGSATVTVEGPTLEPGKKPQKLTFSNKPPGGPVSAPLSIQELPPTNTPILSSITQDDVWGTFDEITMSRINRGMLVARGMPSDLTPAELKASGLPTLCPVWKDKLPYKSVTVICPADVEDQVTYWLEYVHGGGCISKRKKLADGNVALRSNYMCW
jgi:hypothetical protein